MLYPQNGDRIVTTYSVTSLHPMYSEFLHFTRKTLKITIWLCNSMTDLHKIWHDDAQRVFQVHQPLQFDFNVQNAGGWYAWEIRFCGSASSTDIAIDGSCPPSWIFEIEIFNSHAHQGHVLHHRVKFCGNLSLLQRCRIFSRFSSKMQKCTRWPRLI